MKRKIFLFSMARVALMLSLLLPVSVMYAQNQPIYSVPSPEISSLGLYGQIPISHFTGVPDISIPLYEVKVGGFSLPIAVSYHTASVKPNITPGPLGLGWNLIAGGYITRTVRGVYDEKMDNLGRAHGFYAHASKMKNITQQEFMNHTQSHLEGDDFYELCADEFSFNFCGYSGNFYYNEDNGWTVVSDYDIKVEFNANDGFVSFNDLKTRLRYHGWNQQNYNQRYFNKFTLVTPDGCKYEFGGTNAVEFSIPYYNRNNSDMIATTWRLTKITTPQKHVVSIEYDSLPLVCDLQYMPMERFRGNVYPQENPIHLIGRLGYTGFLLFPVNLRKITTSNENIEFTYNRDWYYGRKFMESGHQALYWSDSGHIRGGIFSDSYDDPSNQFFYFTNASPGDSEYESRRNIADSLAYYYLHRIAISNKNGGNSKSYYFDYDILNRRKLSSIIEMGTIPALRRDTVLTPHGYFLITDFLIPGEANTLHNNVYHFGYYSNKLPQNYIVSKTDTWGYYRGEQISLTGVPDFSIVTPLVTPTKAEVLKEITYPTGGKTLFEYELNNYSQRVDTMHTSLVTSWGEAGGLRVSEIANVDEKGHVSEIRKYYYSKNKGPRLSSTSSGILRETPIFTLYQVMEGAGFDGEDAVVVQKCSGGFFAPITNLNSPNVGYSWVIEETLDSLRHSLGYTRYHYSNYDTGADNNNHLDEAPLYGLTANYALSPYTSKSFERGKLLSKEYFTSSGNKLKVESYRYSPTNHASMKIADQKIINFGTNGSNYVTACNGWITEVHTASYLPSTKIDSVFSQQGNAVQISVHSYSYNSHKMVSSDTYSMSNGNTGTVTYKYPFDYTAYNWMTNANVTAPVIEKKVNADGMSEKEIYFYADAGEGVPYVKKKTIMRNEIYSSEKKIFEVKRVDQYGNPIEMDENGKTSVLIWGNYGQQLIAHIENVDFLKCRYQLNLNPLQFSSIGISSLDYTPILSARGRLSESLFHIYKYNGNMLLESETSPNGMSTFYKYDNLGRLREIYYFDGAVKKTISRYDYRYYNQQ